MSNDIGLPLNIACTGEVGFVSIFEHFSLDNPPGQAGFEFFCFQTLSMPAAPHQRFCAMGKSVLMV